MSIRLDSSKIKRELLNVLDMKDDEFSGNQLVLDKKIVPVVSLGFKDMVVKHFTQDDIDNGKKIKLFDGLKLVLNVNILQSNTETDAKNFTVSGYSLSNLLISTQLSINNDFISGIHYPDDGTPNNNEFGLGDVITLFGFGGYCGLYFKDMSICQDSADGTAQVIDIWVYYYE